MMWITAPWQIRAFRVIFMNVLTNLFGLKFIGDAQEDMKATLRLA
ncbi:hypothetical protein [Paenibacillus popilliae]